MKIALVSDYSSKKNTIFGWSLSSRDDLNYPLHLLKNELANSGVEIGTPDIVPINVADLVLFLDIPPHPERYASAKRKWVILFETEVIKPWNWFPKNHGLFDRLFTWNDSFVDEKKYFKLNFANRIDFVEPPLKGRERFACLIAGAKASGHPNELYSERVRTIRWFEKNHRSDFDLFGTNWDLHTFRGPVFIRAFNRVKVLRRLLAPHFPSYLGPIGKKVDVLKRYKFSICFENAKNYPGYITEKIFDCFLAGTIPVYYGAPNVTDFIPEDCFIDWRKFNSYPELYQFMRSLSEEEILGYQKRIVDYLKSPRALPYSADCFSKTLVKQILGALKS